MLSRDESGDVKKSGAFYKYVVQGEVLFEDIILRVISVQNACETR